MLFGSGRPLQCSSDMLCQQNGQSWGRFLPHSRHDDRHARHQAAGHAGQHSAALLERPELHSPCITDVCSCMGQDIIIWTAVCTWNGDQWHCNRQVIMMGLLAVSLPSIVCQCLMWGMWVVQIPIGSEAEFAGVFDLVSMKAITWNGEVSSGCLSSAVLLAAFSTVLGCA